MLKILYRVIILIAVFIAALFYFSRDIKEVVFDINNTTSMSDATFPLVTIKSGDSIINLLHGYSSSMDANMIREAVTPLNLDQTFEVQIKREDMVIKKLNYEVREFVGNSLIESGSVSVFEEEGDLQTAKIKLNTELTKDKEYAVKITLITNKTEKIYFYHRIKSYQETYLKNKLDFIMNFHNSIMSKETAKDIEKYLEPLKDADNSSLAYVNINSSLDLVSWGNLNPVVLTEVIPTIKEIYEDTASVELNYYMKAQVDGREEKYRVTEFYRVRYAPERMYLQKYERHMESIFDISLTKIESNKLKLGITSDLKVPYKSGSDNSKIAFIRDRELWFYDLGNNKITKVFSFRQEKTDYLRDLYDQHDIRILNMDEEGNIDFLVYGYMNRGQYEGRVALVLYHFIRAENRIEELAYIPVEEPYQSLKENLGELAYLNAKDIFYFDIYNTIYSYNIITRKLSAIASNVDRSMVIGMKDFNYAVWQEITDIKKSKNIDIMDLETGEIKLISAPQGYNIRLMDKADSNIIYGFTKEGDIHVLIDGSMMAPLNSVVISSVDETYSKKYQAPDYYVTGLTVKENVIELRRVKKIVQNGHSEFVAAQPDHLINQRKEEVSIIDITSESNQVLAEYYMTLPSGFVLKKLPKVTSTVNTVITQDPTVRLTENEQKRLYYYPYIIGGIEGAYENAADAIQAGKEGIGVVLDSSKRLVWERGVNKASGIISDFEAMKWTPATNNTVASCIKLVLDYQGTAVSINQLGTEDSSAYYVMKSFSKYTPVRLTGITLEDAFYYITKGRPVIAMTGIDTAVIIYGYDAFNIMILDPVKSTVSKMGLQDSTALFENAGNVFLSYLE